MISLSRLHKIGFSNLSSLEDALNKIFKEISVTTGELVSINDSLKRILAEDIVSDIDVPSFDRSAMDGYAVIANDTFGASQKSPAKLKQIGTIEIGESSSQGLSKGEAIRISTGAMIPDGATAVVKIEDTEIQRSTVVLYNSITPGKNISKRGEDIKKGSKVLLQGIELNAEHIALLASLGFDKVKARRNPNVSAYATGDELVEVGHMLGKSQIYNSNTIMIKNLIKIYGGITIKDATLRDNKEIIEKELFKALDDSDIVVFTGGTSVGTKDLLPDIIKEKGTILTHGISMKPGSPILIGIVRDRLIFCLPGTPVAAYICFIKIVGPSIRKMLGSTVLDPRAEVRAIISKDVPVTELGAIHYLRVKIKDRENQLYADPVMLKGSGVISSLTESDGIVEIDSEREGLKKGDQIVVKLFPK